MPDRLKPGQPPLRPNELAKLAGTSYEYIRKLMCAGVLQHVVLPARPGRKMKPERRITVEAAAALLRDLRIF